MKVIIMKVKNNLDMSQWLEKLIESHNGEKNIKIDADDLYDKHGGMEYDPWTKEGDGFYTTILNFEIGDIVTTLNKIEFSNNWDFIAFEKNKWSRKEWNKEEGIKFYGFTIEKR